MILKIKKRKENIDILEFVLEYTLLFLSTICITSVWMRYGFGWTYMNYLKILIPALCILVIGKAVLFDKKNIVPIEFLYNIIFFPICIFASLFSDYPDFTAAVYLCVEIVCFLLITYLFSPKEMERFWRRFVNVIVFISLVSLFFYIFGSVLNIISATETVTYTWDWERKALSYYGIYFAPMSQESDTIFSGIQRNCGIFTEGTMFAFYLIIAYMMESCSSKCRKAVKISLVVTLLTTFSTTGIFSVLIFEGIRLMGMKPKSRFMKTCKILFFPIIVLVVCYALMQLALTKMTTGSYGVRYDHIITCFRVFCKTFPIGLGYNGADVLKSYYYYSQGTSVGIPMLLAYGGLGGALILIIPTSIYFYYSIKMKKIENIALGIAFIWAFFFTNVVFNSVLPWMVITMVFVKGSYEMRKELIYILGGGITVN